MLSKQALTDLIKEKARFHGFQKVGIVPASVLAEGEQLRQWLNLGYQADMDWMSRYLELRTDSGSLMTGARSVVCVAMNYYPGEDSPDGKMPVKIAKYARGSDYHKLIRKRLVKLLADIKAVIPEARGRALADSAPIMEKALAVRAGIGWQGKHANIITQDHGSWLFLAELLLDIELEYDQDIVPNHCGTCTRCIDACPTDAIVQDAVVDASRCIAYWTIEYSGDTLPGEIVKNMDGWVFGCDICQDVCPWNVKFSRKTEEPAFLTRPALGSVDAETVLILCEAEFSRRFANNPIRRTKLENFKRNVRAALESPS